MMKTRIHDTRMVASRQANAIEGEVYWAPVKSLWYLGHLLITLSLAWQYYSGPALLIFMLLTGSTLCLGHSLGMHRRLIHNSFNCPLWLEHLLVYLGVLVGMAGPIGMMRQHDLRDWAQRQRDCHPYLRHGNNIVRDAWWQLNCDLKLHHPPAFRLEDRVRSDPIYRFMERTWMLQQLPWAGILFFAGGLPFVIWGISCRIAISITGHWLVGYFAHNSGQRDWHVAGAAVQGHNVKFAGLLSMGESWHNNHHAFPGSARLGLYEGQPDPGWWILSVLQKVGLAWGIRLPTDLPHREELQPLRPLTSYKRDQLGASPQATP